MNRQELLRLSEKIVIDGSTLRQVYETHLVGEQGLRRVITEHLRGGDVKKALRREIVERDIKFERDPMMRDRPAGSSASRGGAGAAAKAPALQALLKEAGADEAHEREEEAVFRARATYEEKQQELQKQRQQRIFDAALAGTILLLVALVLIVILSRADIYP
jgi:Skp family chaperone for outer membrane proteins